MKSIVVTTLYSLSALSAVSFAAPALPLGYGSDIGNSLNLNSVEGELTGSGPGSDLLNHLKSTGSDFESQLTGITSKLSGSLNPLAGLQSIVSSGLNTKDQAALTSYAQQLMQTLVGELKGHTDALNAIAGLVQGNVTDAEKALAKEAASQQLGAITDAFNHAQDLCSGPGSSPSQPANGSGSGSYSGTPSGSNSTSPSSGSNSGSNSGYPPGSPNPTGAPFPQDCFSTVTGKNGAVNNGAYPVATIIANFLKEFNTAETNLETAFGIEAFGQELQPFDDALDTFLITVGCLIDGLLKALGKFLVDGSAGLESFIQHNSLAQTLIKSVNLGAAF